MVKDNHPVGKEFPARREADESRQLDQSGLFWTSSRCRRLLRPLQSRITALRKLALAEKAGLRQDACGNGETKEVPYHRPAKKARISDDKDGFEGQRKRPRRTYSRRSPTGIFTDEFRPSSKGPLRAQSGRYQGSNPSASGVPHVSTPILRKFRHDMTTATPSDLPSCEGAGGFCMVPKVGKRGPLESSLNELEHLRRSFRPSRYQLYEGIIHDLDVLLRSTMLEDKPVGKKSLLSMCLQKVPQCAAEIEAWERPRAANHGPVSSIKQMSYSLRVYDELEVLGGAGNGWSHLRIVLRAHAIHLLSEIITEGLLDITFIHIVIEHCRAMYCPNETAELTRALLYLSYHGSPEDANLPGNKTGGQLLASLPSLVDNPIFESHLLDTFASLLLSGRIPPDTISTKVFGFLWTTTASAIIDQKTHPSASHFASAGLAALCTGTFPRRKRRISENSIRHNATKLTLMSVLGALSAMAMISHGFGDAKNSRNTGQRSRTQRVVLHILYQALGLVRSQRASREAVYPLLLAIFFSSFPGPAHDVVTQLETAIESLEGSLGQRRISGTCGKLGQLLDVTVALTCSIAHCCGRATARPSNQYFAELCKLVDQLGAPCFTTLRADGAFYLAQKTDDLRDLVFAETLTGALIGKERAVIAHSGSEETFFAGFRWEQGISEWIAVSPVARRRNVARMEVTGPRRSSRHRNGTADVQLDRPCMETTAGATDKTGPSVAIAKTASELDGSQAGQRLAGRRQRAQGDHGSRSEDARATMDGIDELSMCQENRPQALGKSRLGSQAMGVGLRNRCRRVTRSGETGPRMVLAELCSRGNPTGHGDEDELGL
ncbi:hypothetical protein CI238_10480 [Colletotrichum incanum]|uniref:Uncharacterized protein n=1 Tax=Colletotrichum incanum TaxID=1573173 RepID=A0A162NS66_COLIC|nr:hypothetical protein CI238_10480 [Colletotrichum incanum]